MKLLAPFDRASLFAVWPGVLIGILPLYIIRFRVLSVPTTLLEVVVLVIIGYYAIRNPGVYSIYTSLFWPGTLLLCAAIIASFFSFDTFHGVGILKAYFIEPFLLFFCLVSVLKNRLSETSVRVGIAILITWISLLCIWQVISRDPNWSFAHHELAQGRGSAVFNTANAVSLLTVPLMLIIAGWVVQQKRFSWWYLIVLALGTVGVVVTRSRGGLFALVVSLLVMLVLNRLRQISRKARVVLVSTAVVLALLAVSAGSFLSITQLAPEIGRLYQGRDTLQIRLYQWRGTMRLLKTSPIVGAGLDGFHEMYKYRFAMTEYPEPMQYPHNVILTFWVELGLLGLLGFFWLAGASWQLAGKSKYGLGVRAAFIAMLVHGMVDVPYFKNDLAIAFWMLLALATVQSTKLNNEPSG